ncbi:MAG: hypothetical protein D6729_11545 [Deltaproteobacteria bacterium]|nr:MAG: hypothetical protein D6729_11545 [Deltaproteobacteria bacterium]
MGRIGVGASVPPGRAVDLSTEIFSEPGLTVTHDLDRLVLRVWLDAVDLSVGRQAVTWGTAILFPVADLWTTFSPFELDTSQKRGIDALRSTWGLFGGAAELDLVIADRGAIDDLSFGGRVVAYTRVADLWGGIAKHWNEIFLFAGGSADAGAVKLRADLAGIYDLDAAAPQLPRATVGLDAIRPDLSLSLEVHFNGAGAAPGEAYLTYASESEPLGRGETYLMGRVYGGAALRWVPTEPLTVSASALANALDPSAMVVVSLAYAPTEAATVSLGLFRGFGTAPALAPRPELPSEFGAYGAFYYAEISAYF